MSVTVYEPTGIVHSVIAHLGDTRAMTSVVHLTQYDDTLPIIAVKLMNGAQPYKIPESATVSIRVGKPDKTGVYNPCLGVSSDYTTAYFAATEQMCAADGKAFAVVEIIDGGTASTGVFVIDIAENPVNDETILSDSELGIIQTLVDEAEQSAKDAEQSKVDAEAQADIASQKAQEASGHASDALQSKNDASTSEANALQYSNKAEEEAEASADARDKAEVYMQKAQASSAVSNSSYYIGDDGMLHLNFNSEGLGKKDIDQTLSDLQSDVSGLQSDIEQDREVLNSHATQISQAKTDIDAVEKELDTVALRQLNYGNAQVGGTSLGITSTKLLEVEVPSSYRGKRVVLELVGLCVQVSSGTASIEIKKVNGGQDVNPSAFSVDISSGNPAVISRMTMVQTDSNTEAFRVYGYVSASSAVAKIANGNTFYLKVSCMAS